jgi:hypothetical protein
MRRRVKRVGLSIVGAVVTAAVSGWYWLNHRPQPPETDTPLFQGIRYRRLVRRQPRPLVIHLVTVDLTTPGLRLLVTPGDRTARERPLKARTTSGFLKEFGAQVAINGDFFYPWWSRGLWDSYPHIGDPVTVNGRACSNGVCYALGPDREKLPSLFIDAANQAAIARKSPGRERMYNVVSGYPLLIEDGTLKRFTGEDRHPRTAVALDRSGKRLFLVIVDGRQRGYSEGMTTAELTAFIQEQGGWNALNLDGGGSATLAVEDTAQRGGVRVLNSPIENSIPGRERPVANHLAVFAPPLGRLTP